MLTLSLHTLRRLVGAAGRQARPDREAGAGGDLIYRLKAWPQLPESGRTAEVYRMLSVMTTRPVNLHWIRAHVRMEPKQLEQMLGQWASEGALEIIDPARFARSAA